MKRAGGLWLVLFAVYAAGLGLHASGGSEYSGHEPHYLLAAESLVEDHDLDVRNQYVERAYADFHPRELEPDGRLTEGRLHEPHGAGFALLIAPAYALGGAHAVELLLAALAALAMALAYLLALRAVPDPWALGAALGVGLSPPLIAYGTAIGPELTAAAVLAGAALLALRLERRVTRSAAFGCFLLLGALPWLGFKFVPAGVVVGVLAVRPLLAAHRRTLAVGAVETTAFSVALWIGINEALYGGPTPYSAVPVGESATGASSVYDHLERSQRLVTLLADDGNGLLRWVPSLLLVFVGLWLLYRAHREHLTRAVPGLSEMERTGALCATVIGVQLVVTAFLAPTTPDLAAAPRHLLVVLPLAVPLVALGLRRLPRLGVALVLLTVAFSVWLYVDLRFGGGELAAVWPGAPLALLG